MKFEQVIFRTNNLHPKPEILFDEKQNLLLVATPWGDRNLAKKSLSHFQDFFLATNDDTEATAPFSLMTCLDSTSNSLRIASRLTNDSIYYEDNKNEYLNGIELFSCSFKNNILSWAQVGAPHLFLIRKTKVIPLSLSTSLNHDVNKENSLYLPKTLLGLHSTSQVRLDNLRVQNQDKILLLSYPYTPSELYNVVFSSLENLKSQLIDINNSQPFWCGLISDF